MTKPQLVYKTGLGEMWHGDSLDWLDKFDDNSINLVLTSPPFALTRAKEYGNKHEADYVKWFMQWAEKVHSKLTPDGSFVIDLGGAWQKGSATRSLYQYKLLIEMVENSNEALRFSFAEDLYWFNRAKLPGPRQWVTIDRTRVKDAVNTLWWMSKTANPKADNRRVLKPYSKSMQRLLARGTYNNGMRPSEHLIGDNWAQDLGGAIPPNVIEVDLSELDYDVLEQYESDNMLDYSNTAALDGYHLFCKANDLWQHPARFPRAVPEFFINLLTEPGDLVVDIFGGSNMTGGVAQTLGRRWMSCELDQDYIAGSLGRFEPGDVTITNAGRNIALHGAMYKKSVNYVAEQKEKRRARREAQTALPLEPDLP